MRNSYSLLLAGILLLLPTSIGRAQITEQQVIPLKWFSAFIPEDLPPLPYRSYYTTLEKAQFESFRGRYKLSLITVSLVKPTTPDETLAVALVRANSLSCIGQKEAALDALADPAVAGRTEARVLRARILSDLGRYAESISLLQEAVRQDPQAIAPHFYLGQLLELVGNLDAARDAYKFFEPYLQTLSDQGARNLNSAEDLTLVGRGLDRWATLTGAYQGNTNIDDTILSIFTTAYGLKDLEYWPAHLAQAEYYLSHDDMEKALAQLNIANQFNPNDEAINALFGRMSLQQFDFDGADRATAALREVDSTSIAADLLECRNLLQQRRPKEAAAPVERVLARQPSNLEALGLLAATEALQLHDDRTAELLKDVEKVDPNNAAAYLEVAEQLAAMRQYPRSAAMYQIAITRAPWWTTARNGLGLLYTQSGDEDLARKVLDAAASLDPYNHATHNYLILLDHLEKFSKKESEHFIVFYDKDQDPVIPEYFSDYLESIYSDVCGHFHHEPAVKTYIEVFPRHDEFSVRTTGSPWIGTVGASTGRVIAMVAPRSQGQDTLGPFNWAQVLRHEFTHTVTLSMTDNRIAHWFTEGLAVYEEGVPLRWEWVPMLYQATTQHQLFTMDNLTWGFVRPKRPIDRQLAYAESYWICKYIEESAGHEAILKMLEQFRLGKEQDEVFPMILGKSMPQFQSDFFAWCDAQVATWGYDDEHTKQYESLVKQGEALIKEKKYVEAAAVWEQIVKIRPVDQLPHTRLAALYLTPQAKNVDKAVEHLLVLHKLSLRDNRYTKRIARLYRDDNRFAEAQHYALQAVYIDPYDMSAHELLEELDQKTNDQPGLAREQRVIPILQAWLDNQEKASEIPPENPQ